MFEKCESIWGAKPPEKEKVMTREERIRSLTDEYEIYLNELTDEELKMIIEENVFTIHTARELRKKRENEK